ncbi:TIGR01459 family HAD-type hydrolase [Moritella sp. 5]|uniref:TIGR01459 family HAD-type hydrolase n=1 Tax=Moritella sp. 5 TaxID=2746231 RepID=UPI001BA6357E|nr:TIGR01459 family HAD-type hydrolase [Moritella sp. 5]QUM82960.1 TIGR01459 family HAD-type hydrolase [Moritella sp. 5]
MISGLKVIINEFDTFILDQWGVLHNGGDAFPNAIEALAFLKQHGKKVVILSNSGNSHHFSYQRLTDSGICRDLYIDVLTSGDHMRHNFKQGKFDHLGSKALTFAFDDNTNANVLEDCDLTSVDIEDATLIMCYGVGRGSVAEYQADLEIAYARGLEMVVSNPDLVAMTPDGELKLCPGSIANAYVTMGGKVHWHGKPQAEVYDMCHTLLGGWDNAIAVGDSLDHDIRGANTAGISSLFLTTGIHAEDLTAKMATKDDVITASVVADLSREFDVMPSHYIDWFQVN